MSGPAADRPSGPPELDGVATEGVPAADSPSPSLDTDPATAPVGTVRSRLVVGWQAVTGRGRSVAAIAVGAAVLGAATGWREWVGIAAALAVLLIAALLMALGTSSCTADLELPRTRFDVGEQGWATLLIHNDASRRMLPLQMELEIRDRAAGGPGQQDRADGELAVAQSPSDTRSMSIPSMPGGGSHTVHVLLPTEHRAVIALGPLRAVRGDVFGLIRRVVQWPVYREVHVWPRIARPAGLLPGFVRDLEGDESTTRTASDLSFHTLREYVPGDDRRFIHWKSSARNGTLQVREFLQTHRSMVAVILSGNREEYHWGAEHGRIPDGDPGLGRRSNNGRPPDAEFELAVSCAAGTAVVGRTAENILDLFCTVAPQPAPSPDLAFATRQVLRRNPRASVVILVFGSLTEPARVRAAVRACPPGAIVLSLRARVESSPAPLRLAGPDASRVLTLNSVDALPGVLRSAG
jgi:hypothetical protein